MPAKGVLICHAQIRQGMYTATIPGAMTKKIAEPAMASIRLIAEDSKSPLTMADPLEVSASLPVV